MAMAKTESRTKRRRKQAADTTHIISCSVYINNHEPGQASTHTATIYLKELNIKKQSRAANQRTPETVNRITGTTGSGTRGVSQTLGPPTNNPTTSD